MANHKKSKRVKQQFFTTKGRELQKAVSSNLLLQQAETSKSIKNYNTAGINYDKRIYNKLVRNMEAQKIASRSDDAGLKLKLKNYGDALRDDLKGSIGNQQGSPIIPEAQMMLQPPMGVVQPPMGVVDPVTLTSQERNRLLEAAYTKAYLSKKSDKAPTMKEIQRKLTPVNKNLIGEDTLSKWLKTRGAKSLGNAKRARGGGGVTTRLTTSNDRGVKQRRNERATAVEKRETKRFFTSLLK